MRRRSFVHAGYKRLLPFLCMNYLEQLVAEWYEYQGYFVRRNALVGKRANGGWDCELDVVAFHPGSAHLIHIEPSMDTNSWAERERRYAVKFAAGRKYIPAMFKGLQVPKKIEQVALFGYASKKNHPTICGGEVKLVSELLEEITSSLRHKKIANAAVSEQYPILRTIQFMCEHGDVLLKQSSN